MKVVAVTFKSGYRDYEFETKLDLEPGQRYNIVADRRVAYSCPVTVVEYRAKQEFLGKLREITEAELVEDEDDE